MRIFYGIVISFIAMVNIQLFANEGGVRSVMGWHSRLKVLDQQVINIKSSNKLMVAEIEDLKSAHAGIEVRARYELGMIKAKEHYIQLVQSAVEG